MSEGPRVRRLWIPIVVVALFAATTIGLMTWPDLERGQRAGTMVFMVVPLTLMLLTVWLLFLSGMRWPIRIGVLVGVVALVGATIRGVEFEGDMVPIVHYRWERRNDLRLQAHRAGKPQVALRAEPIPPATSEDFPEYRNRNRDGVVAARMLETLKGEGFFNANWTGNPPRELWRQPCGGGYAGIAVVGSFAVTIEQRGEDEAVVCYDTATGAERWVHQYAAHFSEPLGGDGPRATPTIADGDVYSLGGKGMLKRLDGATGSVKWETDILAENDNIQWGMSGSPLVYDRFVVVNPGAQREAARGRAIVAYDRETGKPLWSGGARRAGYSSPQLMTVCGVRQVLLLDGEGISGYDPASGREFWGFPWATYQYINVAQPIVLDGDRIFVSSGYNHGCAMIKVAKDGEKWSVDTLWENRNMRCKFTSPVLHKGCLYGMDEGILTCVDAKDGTRKWKEGRFGNGQLLLAGDYLLIGDEAGKLLLVRATPEGYKEVGRVAGALPDTKNWNHLTFANYRVYLRNHFEMVCYGNLLDSW
jgi:outer membrane protein assembly factor BamB